MHKINLGFDSDVSSLNQRDVGLDSDISSLYDIISNSSSLSSTALACSKIALHIQSNTTNGSTTFTDLSNFDHTITANSIDHTTESSYIFLADSVMDFTANGHLLVGSDGTKGNLKFIHDKTSNWTIEGWIRRASSSVDNEIIFGNAPLTANVGVRSRISLDKLQFTICNGTTTRSFDETIATTIPLNDWVHYAICYNGTNIICYINGSSTDGFSDAWNGNVSNLDPTKPLRIGAIDRSGSESYFNGHMQDFRISKQVVYTGNFNPPTSLLANVCG